jgi:hypothetical protein
VAAQDFFFSLEFSSQGAPVALIEELTSHVLKYVGLAETAVSELGAALQQAALGASAGQRRCDIQFRVGGGKLEIVVTANGGRVWQTTRVLS